MDRKSHFDPERHHITMLMGALKDDLGMDHGPRMRCVGKVCSDNSEGLAPISQQTSAQMTSQSLSDTLVPLPIGTNSIVHLKLG